MSLWDVFGEKFSGKSIRSISSKPSKLPASPTFEGFESIEIIHSNLKQGLWADSLPMPEAPNMGDQEHAGETAKGDERAMLEADEHGPDEFAAHVAWVREEWKDSPPMIAQDMPNWEKFCVGWWRDCFRCPYTDSNPDGSPCTLWEAAFPGKVKWARWGEGWREIKPTTRHTPETRLPEAPSKEAQARGDWWAYCSGYPLVCQNCPDRNHRGGPFCKAWADEHPNGEAEAHEDTD